MSTIVVVEADRHLRSAVTAFLTRQGYVVRETANARSALGILRGESVQAVLLDLYPAPDGETLLKHMRSQPDLACMPVIAMLDTDCGELLDYLEPGDYLHIPFDMQHLDWMLKKVLAERQGVNTAYKPDLEANWTD